MMKTKLSSQIAFISIQDSDKHLTSICKIELDLYEDDEFCFVFHPFYDIINSYEHIHKTKIVLPGMNLMLKREAYVRENYIPAFISERIPHCMRKSSQIPFVLKWLFDSEKHYFGDNFIVTPQCY